MSDTAVNIKQIAKLARLELTEAEEEQFRIEISDILGYVQQLQEIDVDGVEPTAHATHIVNVTRADEIGDCQDLADTMANAPAVVNDELIKVHVVIGGDGGSA